MDKLDKVIINLHFLLDSYDYDSDSMDLIAEIEAVIKDYIDA